VQGASSPLIITRLTNGTAYTFTVVATNAVGDSVASSASSAVTPSLATVPDPPTSVLAGGGYEQSTVSFTAPVNNGGSAITSYTVTSSPGGFTGTGAASPITVTGLTNGTAYTFTVIATNAIGDSIPSSTSAAVTPNDAIVGSLTTSLASYQAASNDDWVTITSAEYALLPTNISGTVKAGSSDSYFAASGSGGLTNSGSAVVANSVTAQNPAIPANAYLYAFAVRWSNSQPGIELSVHTNTNSGNTSNFNKVGSTLPNIPAPSTGLNYYVRKGVSATNGSTAGLLACFTGTKMDYPNPSFTGSGGYIGNRILQGTGITPIPTMRYLIGTGIPPGPNTALTGNLSGYGSFGIQGLTSLAKQWA
jgi:hypothetical protein